MKRELKFRAWDKTTKQYIKHFDMNENGLVFNLPQSDCDVELEQFTGLKDKNGKDIYEGDIVKCHDHPTGMEDVTNDVYFGNGFYKVKTSGVPLHDFGQVWLEVIGNNHETPELLQP